jgi:hypothetical protein
VTCRVQHWWHEAASRLYRDEPAKWHALYWRDIESGSRIAKLRLIETANPEWRDLYSDIIV